MENFPPNIGFSPLSPIEFNPANFQLPLNPSKGMINERVQAHVTKCTNEFYDKILSWIDEFSKEQGMTLDDLSDAGYGLAWEDGGRVNFVQVKGGKVKRVKGFRLEITTNVTIPFVGNVN